MEHDTILNTGGNEETLDTHEDIDVELDENLADEDTEESEEVLRERLAKAEEVAHNYKIRAEKAEKLAKQKGQTDKVSVKPQSEPQNNLSAKDVIALTQAQVHPDDIDEVLSFAQFKKISIADALKSVGLKAELEDKAAQRKAQLAMATNSARRSVQKPSNDALLDKARKGELPDDTDDIAKLYRVRKGLN